MRCSPRSYRPDELQSRRLRARGSGQHRVVTCGKDRGYLSKIARLARELLLDRCVSASGNLRCLRLPNQDEVHFPETLPCCQTKRPRYDTKLPVAPNREILWGGRWGHGNFVASTDGVP